MSYDSAAWGALAFALSILLGVVTFFRWRSRGLGAGLRGAAWTMLPVAAWLTGVLELGFDIGRSVGHWAVHVVFSPVVWLGIVLAGISAVLFGAAAVVGRRGHGSSVGNRPGDAPAKIPGKHPGRDPGRNPGRDRGHDLGDDLGDVEAILRKHGIS
jgi:hypothetical protein